MMSPVFKYIFVAIVGVLILLFFINFAFRHGESEEEISAIVLARNIDDNLEAFSMSGNANKDIDFNFETEFNLECNKLSVENKRQVTIPRIIFSPKKLKGKKIHAHVKDWNFPFKITNFYYLANPKTKFYLVYDSNSKEFVKEINDTIPARFRPEMILSTTRINQDYDFIKIAFFTNEVPITGRNIRRIKLQTKEFGTVTFLDENNIKNKYYSKEMLIGAIFSEDSKSYDCAKKQAEEKLEIISSLYKSKANFLSTKTDCNKYTNIISLLNQLSNLNNPQQTIDNIISKNRDLRGDRSCVELF